MGRSSAWHAVLPPTAHAQPVLLPLYVPLYSPDRVATCRASCNARLHLACRVRTSADPCVLTAARTVNARPVGQRGLEVDLRTATGCRGLIGNNFGHDRSFNNQVQK